nr:Histone-lysine N-methyltransferase [Ipomoea batatas]
MSNKGFDSDRRNDAVAVPDLRASTASSSGAVNDGVSSVSAHSGDARASEDVENAGGMDLDRGVSLVSDDSAIRNEDRKLNAERKKLGSEVVSSVVNLEDKGGTELIRGFGNSIIDVGHSKIAERSNGTERNSVVYEYDLMLSKFDDFAANGRRWTVGLGFEMGDMVWGKVKSHPWWPGHIFNEAFATTTVQRSRRDDHILVAFFGDSSYGWFEPSDLVPFDSNFHEKSQQTNLRSFTKAVEEAVEELSRRCALGLLCRCRQADNFRPLSDEGSFQVDLSDTETNFIYTASQIKKARENFHPRETLTFAKKLALTPMSCDYGNINFIKNRATAIAYRKAVFAPHDPTYAEAFGAHVPKHLQQTQSTAQPSKGPQRASLSGRLISMEAMGKGKTSVRHNKAASQTEKDRYLFKRRDEPENLKSRKVAEVQAGSSSQPIHVDSSVFLGKGSSASVTDNTKSSSIEELKQPLKQDAAVGEFHRSGQVQDCVGEMHISVPTEAKPQGEGFRVRSHGGAQKVKNRKRAASDASSETNQLLEKKKKKKKKILSTNEGSNFVEKQVGGAVERIVNQKFEGDSVPVPSGTKEDIQMDNQQKGDGASISSHEQAVSQQAIGIKSVELELPQVLCDLQTLALNPFHGMERSCPTTTRTVFLRFRSLVFQKSLVSSPGENESNQVPSSKLPAIAPASDGVPAERIREAAPVKMPPKPSVRPDDPTRGGRKRSPSNRQEELSAKKKKKMNDLKQLAAEKKAPQRASEVPKSDNKEMVTKMSSSIPTKLSKPEVSKRIEHSPRVPEPTMLIMKFPPNGALPSIPELKAKFARFGPLDHSATRVFWKSSTCRLVYRYKHHAESALKFAESSTNLFGNTDVKCALREAEAAETSGAKVSREDSSALGGSHPQSKDLVIDRPPPASRVTQVQLLQQPVQLKSCLKRPPGEEAAGNGNNRGTRVKFDLGGEDSSRGELSMSNDSKNTKTAIAASSSSSDTNVKNFSKVIPPSPSPAPQFQNPPITTNVHLPEVKMPHRNMHNFNTHPSSSAPPLATSTADIDISQEMISLLTMCHEVVINVTNVLGFPPYRPL